MKSIATISILSILNISYGIIPDGMLMVGIGFVILLDFITGIIKAVVKGDQRTSVGYRKTVKKFTQYFGAIGASIIAQYALSFKLKSNEFGYIAEFMNNGLLLFIIFIELTSIFENLIEVDNKSPFAVYFIKPLHALMTIAIKNNKLNKQAESINQQNTES